MAELVDRENRFKELAQSISGKMEGMGSDFSIPHQPVQDRQTGGVPSPTTQSVQDRQEREAGEDRPIPVDIKSLHPKVEQALTAGKGLTERIREKELGTKGKLDSSLAPFHPPERKETPSYFNPDKDTDKKSVYTPFGQVPKTMPGPSELLGLVPIIAGVMKSLGNKLTPSVQGGVVSTSQQPQGESAPPQTVVISEHMKGIADAIEEGFFRVIQTIIGKLAGGSSAGGNLGQRSPLLLGTNKQDEEQEPGGRVIINQSGDVLPTHRPRGEMQEEGEQANERGCDPCSLFRNMIDWLQKIHGGITGLSSSGGLGGFSGKGMSGMEEDDELRPPKIDYDKNTPTSVFGVILNSLKNMVGLGTPSASKQKEDTMEQRRLNRMSPEEKAEYHLNKKMGKFGEAKDKFASAATNPSEMGGMSDAMGGVSKLGSALGGPIVGGLFKVGEVALGSVDRLMKWSDQLHQSNMQFAEFSASMTQVQVEQEIRDMMLSKSKGDARSESARDLAEAKSRLSKATAPLENAFANMKNKIAAGLSNFVASLIEGGNSIGKAMEPVMEGMAKNNEQFRKWLDENKKKKKDDDEAITDFGTRAIDEAWLDTFGLPPRFANKMGRRG